MTDNTFIATAWRNGKQNHETGAGFGLRISAEVRDKFFDSNWEKVEVIIYGEPVSISLEETFWGKCSELRGKEIGSWLIENDLDEWDDRKPSQVLVIHQGENKFALDLLEEMPE